MSLAVYSLLNENIPWNVETQKRFRHCVTAGNAACRIASCIPTMDPQLAFTYGLLHDIGKFGLDPSESYKHPRRGYEILKDTDPQAAIICLTHSFPCMDAKDYIEYYCHGDNQEAELLISLLSKVEQNAYIPLIQLCDKLSNLDWCMSLEAKFEWYQKKHPNSNSEAVMRNFRTYHAIKANLEQQIGEDLYTFLRIV